jgi:hypothetical protein
MTDMSLETAARIALLTQLVRLLMRERALQAGMTPEDVLAYAETVRQFFEGRGKPRSEMGMYIDAQVTAFFDVLAKDLKQARGNH